tara:strand:+ start:247 stop:468 length:222 start_codon:yes stop_codon:yes gene_type:complete
MKTQIINATTKEAEIKEMTSEEVTLHNQLIAQAKISEDKFDLAEKQKADKKASAITKLKELGLTDDEIGSLKI